VEQSHKRAVPRSTRNDAGEPEPRRARISRITDRGSTFHSPPHKRRIPPLQPPNWTIQARALRLSLSLWRWRELRDCFGDKAVVRLEPRLRYRARSDSPRSDRRDLRRAECWFPCVWRLWTAAPRRSAPTRRGSTLPMHVHGRLAFDASPASATSGAGPPVRRGPLLIANSGGSALGASGRRTRRLLSDRDPRRGLNLLTEKRLERWGTTAFARTGLRAVGVTGGEPRRTRREHGWQQRASQRVRSPLEETASTSKRNPSGSIVPTEVSAPPAIRSNSWNSWHQV
jgi:hypothetical protein